MIEQKFLTKNFILSNRTKRGSWTQSQLSVIGVSWPPRKKWLNRVNGQKITLSEQSDFEQFAHKFKQSF